MAVSSISYAQHRRFLRFCVFFIDGHGSSSLFPNHDDDRQVGCFVSAAHDEVLDET